MPHPVPPPEPTTIVKRLPSEEVKFPHSSASTIQTLPEALREESSPFNAATSAALLGSPISVGYAVQPTVEKQTYRENPSPPTLVASASLTHLLTQERGGEVREFQIPTSPPQQQPLPALAQASPTPTVQGLQQQPVAKSPLQTTPLSGKIELTADRQEYDADRQVITAVGHVVMRFQQAVLDADRLEVNIPNRMAVAQGNVVLRRGQQLLQGSRFEYNFVQDSGVILNASGEFYEPTASSDFAVTSANNVAASTVPVQPLSDRILTDQPLQQITNPSNFGTVVGSSRSIPYQSDLQQGGSIGRLRWVAKQVDFDASSLQATDVRITNDPFSPPELELRTPSARFSRITPLLSEVTATHPRLVFDQNFQVPVFQNRISIDRRPHDPALLNFGYDGRDRGGLFIGHTFEPVSTPAVLFRITPQFFIQKAIEQGKYFDPSTFGLTARLDATLAPRTKVQGRASFFSVDPSDLENNTRANLQLQQIIGTSLPHTLSLQYNYRDRLYNGSLGYQTVQSSLGAILTSPTFPVGKTGIYLNYQGSAQYINADTDRPDLLKPNRTNNRVNLNRYQASASLNRSFVVLQGKALPPTPTEGLRYTPVPVVPYLQINTGITGVLTGYSSGDTQNSISGSIGLQGQIGHFSKPILDYTSFNITYYETAPHGASPFLFDRLVDTRVLSGGINQQIYGPFRLGFQTSVNLDNHQEISTDYLLDYSRRTYNILLRYNPVLQLGSISFRLNGFNWVGNPEPLLGSEICPVEQGVPRCNRD